MRIKDVIVAASVGPLANLNGVRHTDFMGAVIVPDSDKDDKILKVLAQFAAKRAAMVKSARLGFVCKHSKSTGTRPASGKDVTMSNLPKRLGLPDIHWGIDIWQ